MFTPIDDLPEPPRYGQIREVFVPVANRFFGDLPNFQRQLNQLAQELFDVAQAANQNAGSIGSAVETITQLSSDIDAAAEQISSDAQATVEAAGSAQTAKQEAQALYGDLNAVEAAKGEAQQAATASGSERSLAQQARVGALAAQEGAETARDQAQQAAVAEKPWSQITEKPIEFPPSAHSHSQSEVEGLAAALADKLAMSDVLDSLTSTLTDRPLSANQGRVLKGLIDSINTLLASDDTTLDELQEIVEYIKLNRAELDALSISSVAGLASALAGKAAVEHSHSLAQITDAGTAAAKNTPASGDAAADQVVKGDDSRLSDARTPTEHSHDDRYYTKNELDSRTKGDPWTLSAESVTFSYDNDGRLIGMAESVDGDTRTTSYSYSTDGTLTGTTIAFRGLTRNETYIYSDGALSSVDAVIQEAP